MQCGVLVRLESTFKPKDKTGTQVAANTRQCLTINVGVFQELGLER